MIRDTSPEDLLRQRERRINEAIALREPDRVPVMCYFGFFPAKFAGITYEEAMYDVSERSGRETARSSSCLYCSSQGHRAFMSPQQFKTFYWPTLKRLILGLVEEGLNPFVFWEGDCTSRLKIIGDIPKGKVVYMFDRADIFKAKEVLDDRVCLRGNVPLSILSTGTQEDVRAYCKKLIDRVGKGGGFIMDASSNLDDAKAENLKAMIDFTKEYGQYA